MSKYVVQLANEALRGSRRREEAGASSGPEGRWPDASPDDEMGVRNDATAAEEGGEDGEEGGGRWKDAPGAEEVGLDLTEFDIGMQ